MFHNFDNLIFECSVIGIFKNLFNELQLVSKKYTVHKCTISTENTCVTSTKIRTQDFINLLHDLFIPASSHLLPILTSDMLCN